jgi:hypothetical protein
MLNKARKSAWFAVFWLGVSLSLPAQEAKLQSGTSRPRIGLVLSGGGARVFVLLAYLIGEQIHRQSKTQ